MAATVLSMSTSLDGFIAGPNERPGNGLGDGGHCLHEWAMTGGDLGLEAVRPRAASTARRSPRNPDAERTENAQRTTQSRAAR